LKPTTIDDSVMGPGAAPQLTVPTSEPKRPSCPSVPTIVHVPKPSI
jgi:hypothetical protein